MLVTDWGDLDHVNDLHMAIPGIIIGTQETWNPEHIPDETEMLHRISRLEYHDASGELLDIPTHASHSACFQWNQLITWLELDDGQGGVSTEILQTIPGLLPENERPDDAIRTLQDESQIPSLAESRLMLLPTNRHDRRRHRTTGHSERRGTPHSHRGTATSESGRSPTCSDAGVVDSLQLSAASQHDDTARLAEALEIWMEAYAAQWSTVSQGSGLRRLQDTVRELTDYLRFQSI